VFLLDTNACIRILNGPDDLLIAATARAHDLVLVTNNRREFERIPGMRLDDWEAPAPTRRR
jgi:tRNA(fMet)-specific endonuclease VapC